MQIMTTYIIDTVEHGYNHDVIYGHYEGDDPTQEDVAKRFFHEYFGGRHPWVDTKHKCFGVTVHGCD